MKGCQRVSYWQTWRPLCVRRHLLLTVLAIKTFLGISVNLHSLNVLSEFLHTHQGKQIKEKPHLEMLLGDEETVIT